MEEIASLTTSIPSVPYAATSATTGKPNAVVLSPGRSGQSFYSYVPELDGILAVYAVRTFFLHSLH